MNITVLYVGSSLLAPLKSAEREIDRAYNLGLRVAAYNFGSPLSDGEWREVERDLEQANLVFVIHVMDGENASRLLNSLETLKDKHEAVIVINCMPELMRRTRMGRLDVADARELLDGQARVRQKQWQQARASSLLKTNRSPAGHFEVCANRRSVHRREALPVSLLLLSPADAGEHSIDAALCLEALRSR